MWKLDEFQQFVRGRLKKDKDRDFLLSLDRDLRQLNKLRKKAEHPPTERTSQQQNIAWMFQRFMGIGCPGILPRLVEIKGKFSQT
jgi:hypothetical protein